MDMTKLTDKQRQAMLMRYTYGWRLARIAMRMGTTRQGVHDLLQRAHLRLGFPRLAYRKPWLPKPRARRRKPLYLSELPHDIASNLRPPAEERRNIGILLRKTLRDVARQEPDTAGDSKMAPTH